ncbi:MAG TPA: cyclic-di-AMP receptor [Chloroflexia bacterium]|nr:cyclic-di-AMP receptor [Chloroflexia bacterium]
MKMVLAIVQRAYTDPLLDALTENGYRATRLASTGGFRREGNTTLIIGTEDAQVDQLVELVRATVARAAGAPGPAGADSTGRGALFVLPLADSFQL